METAQNTKKLDVKYIVNALICVALLFGFGYLPTFGPVTPVGMKIIGVFLGVVWGWSTVDKIWPSALGLVALGLSGYCTVPEAIEIGMKSPTVWQILLMLIVAGGISETQFPKAVVNWLLSLKFAQGRPWVLNGLLLYCTYIVVVLVNIPGLLLMWSIFYSMANMLGYKKGDKYTTVMIIGMFIAFMFGNCFLPFVGVRAILGAAFANITGSEIAYGLYMVMNVVVSVIAILLYLVVMKFAFRVDVSKLQGFVISELCTEKIKLNVSEKVYVIGFFAGLSLCLVINILPQGWALTQFLQSVSLSGIFAILMAALAAIHIGGQPVLDVAKTAAKSVQWGIIFIVVAVIPITNALTADVTGVNELINQTVGSLFKSSGPMTFVILIIFFSTFLTNLMANVGVGMMILPLIVSIAPDLGINMPVISLLMIFAVNIAYITPGASPLAGLLHGNDWIKVTDIYRYGVIGLVIMVVVTFVLYPVFALFV